MALYWVAVLAIVPTPGQILLFVGYIQVVQRYSVTVHSLYFFLILAYRFGNSQKTILWSFFFQ